MMEYEILKKAIEKILQVYNGEILSEATFETELGADSIDMAQIMKLVEDELGIKLPADEWGRSATVGDALELIMRVKADE